jgi:apolipoprotein N-acyltransferase
MRTTRFSKITRLVLAAFVGFTTALAFAPYNLWPIAILSPAILLLLIHQQTAKQASAIGFMWGFGFFSFGISWVHVSIDTFGGMPKIASIALMALLASYLALYPALFTGLLNRFFPKVNLTRFILAAPTLWLISEWLRGWVMTGFPWLWLGYSQIDSPLKNLAPVGGVDLVSFACLLIAGPIAYSLLTKRWKALLVPVIIAAVSASLNSVHWVELNPASTTKFAIIQGNITQSLKWNPEQRWPTLNTYSDLSEENKDADIIIWPEAAIPAFQSELPNYLRDLDAFAKQNRTTIITGILNRPTQEVFFNSVLTLGNNGTPEYQYRPDELYHKHHLLPFGEFVPFEEWLRPIAPLFNLPMSSFSAGAYLQPNILASGRHLVAALCYEIIFNQQVKDNLTDQTDFILTLSNDAWFGHSNGPVQHMQIARMRALELGKPLIRSTNNGITAVTNYRGDIIKSIPAFKTAVLKAEVTSTTGQTPFKKLGTWPLYLWGVLSMIVALYRQTFSIKDH